MVDHSRPVVVDRRDTPRGELVLRRAGEHHEVIANGTFMMDTRDGRSERALVREALAGLSGARLLLGGLGVGFSLDEALRGDRVSDVVVIELEPAVVEWAGTHLRRLNRHGVDDHRVRLVVGDLRRQLGRLGCEFDAICLDRRQRAGLAGAREPTRSSTATTASSRWRGCCGRAAAWRCGRRRPTSSSSAGCASGSPWCAR